MESDEGKELERLIAVGDYAAARRLVDSVTASEKAKAETTKLRRGFHADPVSIVLVTVAAVGLLVSFFSYSGAP